MQKILIIVFFFLIILGGYWVLSIAWPQTIKISPNVSYMNSSPDVIRVFLPFPDAVTGKDFSIMGEARGTWFFEASFPIKILDKDDKILTTAIAQAQGDWMTEDFVGFRADVKIPVDYIGRATLVLEKDNPSGLTEKRASISFPIMIEY